MGWSHHTIEFFQFPKEPLESSTFLKVPWKRHSGNDDRTGAISCDSIVSTLLARQQRKP